MHQIKIPTTLSQTAIMEMNCEPTLTFVGNSWKFIVGEKQRQNVHEERIDHREGIESGRQAIALWSKGWTVKTIGAKNRKKRKRKKGEEARNLGRCKKVTKEQNLPSAKGSRRSGEMIICLRRALYSSSRSAIFCGRCSANGSYCKD